MRFWKKMWIMLIHSMFLKFVLLGVLSVTVVCIFSKENMSKVVSKGEVQAVLIVALPTLIIWNIDMSARRNEDFYNTTLASLNLRGELDKRFFQAEKEMAKVLKSINSDTTIDMKEWNNLRKILINLHSELNFLESLTRKRKEILYKRMYLVEFFMHLCNLEAIERIQDNSEIATLIESIKLQIIQYYINNELVFKGDIQLSSLSNLFETLIDREEFIIRNINFHELSVLNDLNLLSYGYVRFENCVFSIEKKVYLVKGCEKIEFKNCNFKYKCLFGGQILKSKSNLEEELKEKFQVEQVEII